MEFYLSSKSLKNIKEAGFEDDFEIIIFDETIKCSKFVSSFLSPKISKVLRADFSTNRFIIEFPNKSIYYKSYDELKEKISRTNFISKIKMLINGQSIEIEDEDEGKEIIELLKEFGNYLDNEEMKYFFHEKTEKRSKENNEMSQENIKEMIRINRQYNKSSEQEKVLNFLSRNFYRISEYINIEYLNENELEIILSSPELKIESEDCLFDFISSFELPKYCFLFDYINVEYLSNEKMQEMLDIINNYEMTFHHQLWKSICRRLVMNSKQTNKNQNPRTIENKQETIECSKGIIDYLRNESNINNNPYESKLIEVETSIIKDGQIKNLFDNTIDTHFRLKNVENGFILLDFKDKRINFSKYYFSVPSSRNGRANGWPKTWQIEGSNDKKTWDMIDIEVNDANLCGFGKNKIYTCQNITKKYYRFIRIKEIVSYDGPNYETHFFLLSELEFYGSIEINKK